MKTNNPLENKVFAYMEQYRMLQPGDRVLVGVSGGADSVCLLFLLDQYRKKIPFEIAVIHVHHGVRADADTDAEYVRNLCEKLDVPFFLERADVPARAREEGISEEEAGRKARYEAFEKYAEGCFAFGCGEPAEEGAGKTPRVRLALAHHMGDRAETLLFHLFRGTGSRGLCSIRPVREHRAAMAESGLSGRTPDEEAAETGADMTVIRPLLCLERREIEAYLSAAGISYCQDSTNQEDRYARNRIRHHILSCAEREICEGAVRHINQAAEQFSEIEEYLAAQTDQAYGICVDGADIRVDALLRQPPLIRKRILLKLLLGLSPRSRDIGAVHVEALLELCGGGTGRSISLPWGIRAEKNYDVVTLERRQEGAGTEGAAPLEVFLPAKMQEGEVVERTFGEDCFRFHFLRKNKIFRISENQYTKWFDYGKIKGALSIRTRRAGDYLMIRDGSGRSVRKKVKEYMITEKIPRRQREELALLADGDHILWIPGYRISEACKVDENTEYILQVELARR